MARLTALLLVLALLAVGCGGKPFPKDAVATLREAADRSSSARATQFRGSLGLDGRELVLLTGATDMRNRAASLTTADAHRPARFPPFETRFVDGWTYIEVDSVVRRPRRLNPSAKWVAFQGIQTPYTLPIPDRTIRIGFFFTFIDQLRTQTITNAHFVGQSTGEPTKVQFQLPPLEPNSSTKPTYTVSVDSNGRIGEIATVDRFIQDAKEYEQDSDVTIVWGSDIPSVEAPSAGDVQRLAPGEDLYAEEPGVPTTTAPTTTVPQTLGPIGAEDAAAGNKAIFDDNRAQLEAVLREQPDPKLTRFSFDTGTNMISAAFVYAHPAQESRSRYDAFAWHVGQALADSFWFPQLVQTLQRQHVDVALLPNLHIQLDNVSYQCPAAVQIALDAHAISQQDWLQKCTA